MIDLELEAALDAAEARAEAAEAERDSVILAQSAINAQAERAEARVAELEAALRAMHEAHQCEEPEQSCPVCDAFCRANWRHRKGTK